jgi:hypothetical protein
MPQYKSQMLPATTVCLCKGPPFPTKAQYVPPTCLSSPTLTRCVWLSGWNTTSSTVSVWPASRCLQGHTGKPHS